MAKGATSARRRLIFVSLISSRRSTTGYAGPGAGLRLAETVWIDASHHGALLSEARGRGAPSSGLSELSYLENFCGGSCTMYGIDQNEHGASVAPETLFLVYARPVTENAFCSLRYPAEFLMEIPSS